MAAPPRGARLTAAAASPFRPDTVILDVDGVLVDVEPSFRESVCRTVATMQRLMGTEPSWVPAREDVAALKRAGGFNDDIHCSIALTAIAAGGAAPRLPELLAAIEAAGGGLSGLRAAAPGLPRVEGRVCLRVFDEHYWGAGRLRSVFGEEPRYVMEGDGLVGAEEPLVDGGFVERLRSVDGVRRVALITGRTPAELDAALELLAWRREWLDAVVTGDELRKPDPGCVDRIVARCGSRSAVYVGDVRDDWDLVRRYRVERAEGIEVRGVIVGGEADALRPLGVDATLRGASELVELLRWWVGA